MSVLKYQETMNSKEFQVWDNAAFDNGEFSWSQSLESDSSTKENHSPSMAGPGSSVLRGSINPLQVNTYITNTQQPMPSSKVGFLGKKGDVLDEIDVDCEIEEIEKEISRLSSRLEDLRLEKAKRNAMAMEKRGRIVAAKFMDPPKVSTKNFEELGLSAISKTPRRGLSLGPAEIMRGARRGISLGPAEIYSATKLKQLSKEISTPASTRRQSCYWKLQNIDELRVTRERGKSMSLSPKSRSKTMLKSLPPKQAATTIGSKKTVKKEGLVSSIEPKKLFTKEGEKSGPSKKPMKCGRLVPSRYSGQMTSGGNSAMKEVRKRSWPENEEDGGKKSERKRASLNGKTEEEEELPTIARENRVKKRWEIPSEVAIEKTPLMLDVVPKIKTSRFVNESPRDSGPAKRVAELVGRKSYFSVEDNDNGEEEEEEEEEEKEEEGSVCQALDFAEEEVATKKEGLKIRILRCVNESPRDSGAAKRVAELVGKKSFFDDDDNEMPVFSFEEEDGEES